MEAGLGVPDAVLMELQKKNFAGEGRWERRHRLRRLWVPRMCCCSNERTPRLKFTAQALWMMVVVDERRLVEIRGAEAEIWPAEIAGECVHFG